MPRNLALRSKVRVMLKQARDGTSRYVGTARLITAPPAGRCHTAFSVLSRTLGTRLACVAVTWGRQTRPAIANDLVLKYSSSCAA